MSTLLASNIQDRATGKSLGVERVIEGTAKAWVTVNGDQASLQDSFGVSSYTDTGVGIGTMNFITGMANASYAAHSNLLYNFSSNVVIGGPGTRTATGVVLQSSYSQSGGALQAFDMVKAGSVFGDLA